MEDEPLWPEAAELIRLNQLIVEGSGEPHTLLHTLLNEGGLESACARPRNIWAYEDERKIAYLAACLIASIGQNHPFEQGNKRTALAGALLFIRNNGYFLDHPDTDDFGPTIEAVIVGELHESVLAKELDAYLIEELI